VTGQIVFTGTNFFATGYSANATYGGTFADSVTIDSATQVTATWNYGLPPLGVDVVPILRFDETGTEVQHFANITAAIQKTLLIGDATTCLTCSFAGGCNIEV
jgi:hypothetical protein